MKKIIVLFMMLAFALNLCACATAQLGDSGKEPSQGLTWQEQYDLGIRYLSEGNYEEAILAFTAAIEIDPKRAEAYIGLANAYEAKGDLEQARQVLTNALEIVGDSSAIQSRLNELALFSAQSEPTLDIAPEPTRELDDDLLTQNWQAVYKNLI